MSTIYLGEDAVVSEYTASVKGPRAVVTVKIAVTDSYALAHLLRDLEQTKVAAAARRKAAVAVEAERKRSPKRAALEHQEPRLMLPYFGDRS